MTDTFQVENQLHTNWCWAAVGVSLKRYFSPKSQLRQCQLASTVLKSEGGCDKQLPKTLDREADLGEVLSEIGVLEDAQPNKVLSFKDVQMQIRARLPVCARVTWFGEDRGHVVVICGASVSSTGEQWLDIADPFSGNSTITYDQFVQSYMNAGEWTDSYLLRKP